ncbi:MAG: NAD(P)/FAD-dependent oxidoreductase [Cyanobacteriota bacterium]|nr:NAD(P)/FAD-dependent oxidoreductase [Cyanobacteriota bacterium]
MKKTIGIIGGGPAGMSCPLWLKYLGFSPIIIEKKQQLGGLQQVSNFQNVWYLGLIEKTGYEIAEQFHQHIQVEEISTLLGSQVRSIVKSGDNFQIFTEAKEITAQGLVIATGQRIKGYEGIKSIEGSHKLLSSEKIFFDLGATPLLTPQMNEKIIAVIGGGDNGLVTAIRFSETAKHIHLFVRSQMRGFKVNKKTIYEKIEAGKITLHQPTIIHKFEVQGNQISITFRDEKKPEEKLAFDSLCLRIGLTPNIEDIVQIFNEGNLGNIQFSQKGYIATDEFLRTLIPNISQNHKGLKPRLLR